MDGAYSKVEHVERPNGTWLKRDENYKRVDVTEGWKLYRSIDYKRVECNRGAANTERDRTNRVAALTWT